MFRELKAFIQRGKRGWANRDTWNFDYFLADVIVGGVKYLKKTQHGHPSALTQKQWDKILNEITWTFKTAKKISDGDVFYIDVEEYDKLARQWKKKMYGGITLKLLTKKECMKYERGFNLFKKHFFSLWD